MTIDEFLAENYPRLRAYARQTAKRYRAGADMVPDLEQACVLAAMRELKWWRPSLATGAAAKSAFNWCAGPMRREMLRTLRRQAGVRPNGRDPMPQVVSGLEEYMSELATETPREVAERFDTVAEMRGAFAALPRSPNLVRFLAVTLSPASGADLARAEGVSRQAICTSVAKTRELLRAALA